MESCCFQYFAKCLPVPQFPLKEDCFLYFGDDKQIVGIETQESVVGAGSQNEAAKLWPKGLIGRSKQGIMIVL